MAEEFSDSVRFRFDLPFSEVEDAVAGCFEGKIGDSFVGVSVGSTWTIDLDG